MNNFKILEDSSLRPNIVLVGIGKFGKNHLRVWRMLQSRGLCKLRGIVDVSAETLKSISKEIKVETSYDLEYFLDKEDVDAFDVVTPTNTHYEICKKVLEAGKHVLVEKPLTTSYNEAKQLVQIAEKQSKILMAGHIFRYNSAVRKIRELINKGEIGQLFYMVGHFTGLKDPRLDSGALFNFTTHHIDIYDYILGRLPDEIWCCTSHFLGRKHFEDIAFITLKYAPNILGTIEGSWLSPSKARDLTLVGSNKSISCDLLKQTIILHSSHIENRNGIPKVVNMGNKEIIMTFEEPLQLELCDFIKSIKNGKLPLSNGRTSLNVVRIAEKALESSRLGRSVKLNENLE